MIHNLITRIAREQIACYAGITEDQIKLNKSLTSIQAWCKHWETKTFSISFTNKKTPLNFQYKIDDTAVVNLSQVKYLGVTFSSNFSWESHIDNICSKTLCKLNFLRRHLRQAPLMVKLNNYKSLIKPTLEYADIIWNPHQK